MRGGIIVEGGGSTEARAGSEVETRKTRKGRGTTKMGYLILIIK
jgi:hypothetical protein